MHCNEKLSLIDSIPIISFFISRRKCKQCNAKISIKYVLIEVSTAAMFVFLYLFHGISFDLFLNLSLSSMLLITFIIDLEHMVVSDMVLILFSSYVIVYIIFTEATFLWHVLGLAVGFLPFLLIYITVKLIYKREAFGFGDVTLSASVGWFLGVRYSILTSILSFVIASVCMIFLKLLNKSFDKKTEIAFGPFICIAAIISSMFGEKIIDFYFALTLF